jgi:hypothetical protein
MNHKIVSDGLTHKRQELKEVMLTLLASKDPDEIYDKLYTFFRLSSVTPAHIREMTRMATEIDLEKPRKPWEFSDLQNPPTMDEAISTAVPLDHRSAMMFYGVHDPQIDKTCEELIFLLKQHFTPVNEDGNG